MSQISKILFQAQDINVLILTGVFFSRYKTVQLKTLFSDEKTSTVKSEHALAEKLSKINVARH